MKSHNRVDAVRLGRKIRLLRESVAPSRSEFSRRLGHRNSRSYLFYVESGRKLPCISYCERVAAVAGVPLRHLFDYAIPSPLPMNDAYSREIAHLTPRISLAHRRSILKVILSLSDNQERVVRKMLQL